MQLASRFRRTLAIAAPALLVVVGCTMIGDRLTGIRAEKTGLQSCIRDCNNAYRVHYAEEQARHIEAVEACKSLTEGAREECLNAEAALHESNKESLSQGKVDCQNNCHRQGRGSGG